MIIGLTGPNASGKGEAARYITSKGFVYHSLSDILREESKKRGIEPSRENLIKLGNELRSKYGPSFLALCAIERLRNEEDNVVDSIRNPFEVDEFCKLADFILMGIDAPVEIRFERSLKRNRPGDAATLQDFIAKEEKENKLNAENQQLEKCLNMARVVIVNNSTLQEFQREIDEALEKNKKT